MYVNSGATLQLSCLVNETPGPPDYIFWHHNGEVSSRRFLIPLKSRDGDAIHREKIGNELQARD